MRITRSTLAVVSLTFAGCSGQTTRPEAPDGATAGRGDAVTAPASQPPATPPAMPPVSTPPASARAEPLTLALEGWTATTEDDGAHRRVEHRRPPSTCFVLLDRWWGIPPTPGGPMAVASRRPVTVSGRSLELLTTSHFQGVEDEVQVLFYRDQGFQTRVTFRDCAAAETDEVLGRIRIAE
ncbi:MAG: hypothetical protein HYY06_09285 [Deltaproteobacteria bacterium]|nr:hypothetical protein [Deltaproteobacteria bacterium]